jgi:hypothetical protein
MALDVEDTMGRGEDKAPSSLGNNRRSVFMSQPNNLRGCHTTLDQDSSLIAVVEMSQSSWRVVGIVSAPERAGSPKRLPCLS